MCSRQPTGLWLGDGRFDGFYVQFNSLALCICYASPFQMSSAFVARSQTLRYALLLFQRIIYIYTINNGKYHEAFTGTFLSNNPLLLDT